MFVDFLDDRTTHHLDRQFMLGSSLLVAPVFVPVGEESEYYLPAGRWTAFFNPSRVQAGPAWIKEVIPIDQLPVWVRQGTVLALGPTGVGRPDYDFASAIDVHVYELEEGQTVQTEVPSGKGADIAGVFETKLQGGEVVVKVTGGEVGLASVRYFVGGQVHQVDVQQGQREVSLRV